MRPCRPWLRTGDQPASRSAGLSSGVSLVESTGSRETTCRAGICYACVQRSFRQGAGRRQTDGPARAVGTIYWDLGLTRPQDMGDNHPLLSGRWTVIFGTAWCGSDHEGHVAAVSARLPRQSHVSRHGLYACATHLGEHRDAIHVCSSARRRGSVAMHQQRACATHQHLRDAASSLGLLTFSGSRGRLKNLEFGGRTRLPGGMVSRRIFLRRGAEAERRVVRCGNGSRDCGRDPLWALGRHADAADQRT